MIVLLAASLKTKLTLAGTLNLYELFYSFFSLSGSARFCRILRPIQRGLKYSGRVGCLGRALPPRQRFSSAMGMEIPALSFLKGSLRE